MVQTLTRWSIGDDREDLEGNASHLIEKGRKDILQILLDHGTNFNQKDRRGKTVMWQSFFVPSTRYWTPRLLSFDRQLHWGRLFFDCQMHQAGTAFFQVLCTGQSFLFPTSLTTPFPQCILLKLGTASFQPPTASSTTFFRLPVTLDRALFLRQVYWT